MLSSKTDAGFYDDIFEPVLIANPYLKAISMAVSFTTTFEICVECIRKEKNSVGREGIEVNLKSERRIEQIMKLS